MNKQSVNLRNGAFSFLIGVLALGTISSCFGEVAPENLPDGIALNLSIGRVELIQATSHTFRMRVASGPNVASPHSVFLAGTPTYQPQVPVVTLHEGPVVGIKTDLGELRVDTVRNMWSLRDAQGAILADWAAIKSHLSIGDNKRTVFSVEVGPSAANPSPLYYGSGNSPKLGSLTQTEARSVAGNGSTSLPQYWSNTGYGALMVTQDDNQAASWKANPAGGVEWTVLGSIADLYLAPAPTLYDWVRDDAELTGFAPVPPLWSLGYLQSRWGWKNKAYIDETLQHFRAGKFPVDAFIFDFEWYTKTPDYRVKAPGIPNFPDFAWNPILFPSPEQQTADWAKDGLHVVGIRKPRLGDSDNLQMARAKGWILPSNPNDPNGADIKSRDLDYANPDVQSWWEQNTRKFIAAGMAGFWNDEGETTFTEYTYWNLAELDLQRQVDPNARFWSLNRSFAPGVQRFGAAAWTGDIKSDWETLDKTPGELLSYGLSGMPYATCDIGGFFKTPTPELFARWMEAGVFFPIQRSHSEIGTTARFPWLYGPDAEVAIRNALDLRYKLIPYYYSLAFQNYKTGAPLMRPLVMEFPKDNTVSGTTDEWLMGSGLLAAPVLNEGGSRQIYLPKDQWYTLGTNTITQGPTTLSVTCKLDEIPVYIRAGTLLPMGPVRQTTEEVSADPLELQIYPGRDGAFQFVEDDGKTLNYKSGDVRITSFTWDDRLKTLSWKSAGKYDGDHRFHQMNAILYKPGAVEKETESLDQDGSVTFQ